MDRACRIARRSADDDSSPGSGEPSVLLRGAPRTGVINGALLHAGLLPALVDRELDDEMASLDGAVGTPAPASAARAPLVPSPDTDGGTLASAGDSL